MLLIVPGQDLDEPVRCGRTAPAEQATERR